MSLFRKVCHFQLLLYLSIILAFFATAKAQSSEAPLIRSETTPVQNLKVFDALWEKVNTKYFDAKFNGINWLQMRDIYRPKAEKAANQQELLAILKQMLRELKTSHLDIWQTVSKTKISKQIFTNFNPNDDFLYLSYGFSLKNIEGKPVIREVVPNSSAQSNGLKNGWILLSANGKLLTDNDFNIGEVYEGRQIDLRFLDTENKEHNKTLTANWAVRKRIRSGYLFNQEIGYIKFDGFVAGISKWLEYEIKPLNSMKAIILDLRNNQGGYLEEVKKCLSFFFAEDIEFGTFIERSGKTKETKVKGKRKKAFNGKIIVLIDDESFSGAEIFANLMQETGRGKVVGVASRGFVLNSIEYNLPENFKVSNAFRDYLSPKGKKIEGKGVTPDLEVFPKINDIISNRDAILEKALEITDL